MTFMVEEKKNKATGAQRTTVTPALVGGLLMSWAHNYNRKRAVNLLKTEVKNEK